MTFAKQILRAPLPFDAVTGHEARALFPDTTDAAGDLLSGAAGCSPYLASLMLKQRDWLDEALQKTPAESLAEILNDLSPGAMQETRTTLRNAKQKVALLVALADLGGVWALDAVTRALTNFADRSLEIALKSALRPQLARGKVPGHGEDSEEDCAGLVVLAMGKMGAFELNYSSDIDLICLFDDLAYAAEDLGEARAVLVRVVRQAMALLSDITSEGYVFRTDLRLRPDPSVTPVVVSIAAAERYYEALGRTWERAAFIKARPAAGKIAAGERFLSDIKPFIWRRHLDYSTVQDAHDIRQKIRAHKIAPGPGGLDAYNLKLGRGGIREIEFFTQTRQLIAGGRDSSLRARSTRQGLSRLAAKGWVTSQDADVLEGDYVWLREMEHRLQMVQDAQTHSLPQGEEGWQRLAMFTGSTDVSALQEQLRDTFDQVHELTEDFFAPSAPNAEQCDLSDSAVKIIARWEHYPALRSERARILFRRLQPKLLEGFQRAAKPDEALARFDGFLAGLPAGVQLFALFDANPQLIDLMVDIASTTPALARYLSANSGVFDAVIGGDFFSTWPGEDALAQELSTKLAEDTLDYEGKLDTARYWMKDWQFRIGVHFLRGLIGPRESSKELTDLARATVSVMWAVVREEFERKHGPLPGRGAIVLGMGSLGAGQLTVQSDLDLIVIYDAENDAESDGPRPLPARTYFSRLTKALVTGLSAQTAAGTLYEVDMRLRPSGRQGPAATSWSGFQSYQRTQAWTWEHLALTRAAPIAGEATLAADVESFRRALLAEPRDPALVFRDLQDMRARLSDAKPQVGVWDWGNGAGGLQDIDLMAQALGLLSGAPERSVPAQLVQASEFASDDERATLMNAHTLLASVKAVTRLLTDQPLDPETLGHGGRAMLLRDTGYEDLDALAQAMGTAREAAATTIETILSRAASPGPAADVTEAEEKTS